MSVWINRLLGAVLALAAASAALQAQRTDTTGRDTSRREVPRTIQAVDSLRAPLSPRRAFLYSSLVPGSAQSILGRHRAAAAFLLVESISLIMIRESAADLSEARRLQGDTLVLSYVNDAGARTTPVRTLSPFDSAEIHTRQAHVEDWLAFLVANHLFSGADAFVAANLWDVRARLALRVVPRPGGAALAASIRW